MTPDRPLTKADLNALNTNLNSLKADLEMLIESIKESFERETDRLEREMQNGFDRLDSSIKRHSGMIISGTVAIATVTKAVTRLENQMKIRDGELRDLKKRMRRVERRQN